MEIIKTFSGKYLLRVGDPFVVVSGYQDARFIYCERAIILETTNGVEKKLEYSYIEKDKWETIQEKEFNDQKTNEELLKLFVDEWGVLIAENDVRNMAFQIVQRRQGQDELVDAPEPNLRPVTNISAVAYLSKKLPEEFKWLKSKTQSKELKLLMEKADLIQSK